MASRKLEDLRPDVAGMVRAMLAACEAAGLHVLVACTYRSDEEQAALYEQGRSTAGRIVTWARAGQSEHNKRRAADIYPLVNGKLADNKTPEEKAIWETVGAIGEASGLEWGGRWPARIRDMPHFQLKG